MKLSAAVTYILPRFPAYSDSFIQREIHTLLERNCRVQVFSLSTPTHGETLGRNWNDITVHVPMLSLPSGSTIRSAAKMIASLEFRKSPRRFTRQLLLRTHQAGLVARALSTETQQIHSHYAGGSSMVAWLVSSLTGIPFSFTPHATDLYNEKHKDPFLREKSQAAKFVVAISNYNQRYLAHETGLPKGRIPLVRCGVRLPSSAASLRPPSLTPSVISVARLVKKKGLASLVRALALTKDRKVNFECTIVGDGPLRSHISAMIESLNLTSQVHLVGALSNAQVNIHLKNAAAFCLPCEVDPNGDRDGIPVSIMEALSYAVPVIAGDVSGIPELVEHGKTGLLVPPGDPLAIADAISLVLTDRAFALELGKNGRLAVARNFNLDVEVSKLHRLFG